ncbi:DUF6464 family protein [Pseudanabaena sp. PCC 6802]|uniref:DUF6464 family protein n=1 Tax=Pseudanabaena sp. PCC 6802 TaxID=118173 RepID=UPI00034A2848|nr:DUF6464 family protein [Pseudanabaena sp. PCC 6802]
MEIFLAIVLGFLTPILSILAMRRLAIKTEARLRSVAQAVGQARTQPLLLPADVTYVEGIGFAIGDFSCRFNARSAHVRCAVNPSGPCQSCRHYELLSID